LWLKARCSETDPELLPSAKERIREATGDDTLRSIVFDISRRNVWPAPFTGRCLRNAHADRWFGLEIELMRHLDAESAKYAAARDAGDFDIAAVIAGEAVGLIHDIPSAHDAIERVVARSFGTIYPVVIIGCRLDRTLCW
jgi:nitronate monooxygenase